MSTPQDPQCTCRHRPRDWKEVKQYVVMAQASIGFLGAFGVLLLAAKPIPLTPDLYLGQLVAAGIIVTYVVMWDGQIMTGHSIPCASRLAMLRLVRKRASLKETAGLTGPQATPSDLATPSPAEMVARRDKLALVLGAMFAAFGLILLLFDKANKLQNLKLVALGTLIALPALLPATKGKSYKEWPKAYQVAAKLYCVLALIGLIANG